MAAKKSASPRDPAEPADGRTVLDGTFRTVCDTNADKYGWQGRSIVGTEARKRFVGIPVPALSVEMLLMATCWPLARVFQLIGEEGTGKSTLLDEFMRWVFLYGGYAYLCENENKEAAARREAVLEHNRDWIANRLRIHYTDTMDEWQQAFSYNMKKIAEYNEGGPNDGVKAKKARLRWRTPYLFAVDPLVGTTTEKKRAKIAEKGSPTQDYAREANQIKDDVLTWPGRLRDTSILIGATNHMKPTFDEFGHKHPRSPGGKAIKFQESIELELNRIRTSRGVNQVDRGGYKVSLFTAKNSLAPQEKRIWVDVLWEREETDDPKHPRRRIYWDWHAATTEALLTFTKDVTGAARAVAKVLDLHAVVDSRKRHVYWSDALGIPESDPATAHEFGRAIDYNMEIRQLLRAVIGIEPLNHFRPYTPLEEIYETASYVVDDALDPIYNQADRDLSRFTDIGQQLADQVSSDQSRVAQQRREAAAAEGEDIDDILARTH